MKDMNLAFSETLPYAHARRDFSEKPVSCPSCPEAGNNGKLKLCKSLSALTILRDEFDAGGGDLAAADRKLWTAARRARGPERALKSAMKRHGPRLVESAADIEIDQFFALNIDALRSPANKESRRNFSFPKSAGILRSSNSLVRNWQQSKYRGVCVWRIPWTRLLRPPGAAALL